MADPSPYAELIDLIEHLPVLVRETRRRRGLSERAAAEAAGVPFATINRAEHGHALHTDSILSLLRFIADMRQQDRPTRPRQPVSHPKLTDTERTDHGSR